MDLKKSFLLHDDSLEILSSLSDEEAGQLFKAISLYHKSLVHGLDFEFKHKDRAMEIAFKPFENQLKRDLDKYIKRCKKNAENGAKGGRRKAEVSRQKEKSVLL